MDGVPIEKKLPLVLASAGGYPKDINLYQTSKTLANALAMCADGGTIILLSECSEGFGDRDCESQLRDFDTMHQREEALRKDFSIGGYVGFLFAETAEKYNLILVTSIPQEHFSHTKIRCASTLEEALAIAREPVSYTHLFWRFPPFRPYSGARRGRYPDTSRYSPRPPPP